MWFLFVKKWKPLCQVHHVRICFRAVRLGVRRGRNRARTWPRASIPTTTDVFYRSRPDRLLRLVNCNQVLPTYYILVSLLQKSYLEFKKSLSFIEKFTLFLTKVVIFALGNLIENMHEFRKKILSYREGVIEFDLVGLFILTSFRTFFGVYRIRLV